MPTKMSTGASILPSEDAAMRAAIRQASSSGTDRPDIALVFASPKYNLETLLDVASRVLRNTAIVGCSTAGEFTERGITHRGLVVALLSSDEVTYVTRVANGISRNSDVAAQELCRELSQVGAEAAKMGRAASATILLVDTMVSPAERLLSAIRKIIRPHHWLLGGAAADDGALKATLVGIPGNVASDSAVALHVFGRKYLGIGVEHGMQPATAKRRVTRSTGSIINELDGKPAIQIFDEYIRERKLVVPQERMLDFFFKNELGVYFFDDVCKVRAVYGTEPGGGLITTGDIPVGTSVCIVTGDADSLLDATRRAAMEALNGLKGQPAAGVFLFSCMCRMLILGPAAKRELDVVRGVFPGIPIIGFYTYGEIARFGGHRDGFHNTTSVVVAIPS